MSNIKHLIFYIFIFIIITIPSTCFSDQTSKKKVLFVDSYHEGYPWSDGVISGVLKVFNISFNKKGDLDTSNSPVDLLIARMDTKNNPSLNFCKMAALKVKGIIETWKPDVVITCDDNAAKYLIVPYYMNSDLPFVFCGINWDSSVYGFPCSNVTGMEEVTLAVETINELKKHAKGNRIGIIAADVLSEHKTIYNIKNKFRIKFHEEYLSKTFSEWKNQFLELQSKVDMILFTCNTGIVNWDEEEAIEFLKANIEVPIGTMDEWVSYYAVIALTKMPSEQGEYSAQTALKILNGASPSDIHIVQNRHAKVILNMHLAKKLKIKFPMELINRATFVNQE